MDRQSNTAENADMSLEGKQLIQLESDSAKKLNSDNNLGAGASNPQNSWFSISDNKILFGRIPKILLYLGFAALAVLYAVSVAAPVLFAGGIILATAFAFRAISEGWKIYTKGPGKKLNWLRPNFLESLSSGIIGTGLLTLGVLMLINPAFLGAFLGVSLAVKIWLVVAGVTFLAKGILNYFSQKLDMDVHPKRQCFLNNLPDALLYGVGLALGIMALVMNGAFVVVPVLFATVFLMRIATSILRMFNPEKLKNLDNPYAVETQLDRYLTRFQGVFYKIAKILDVSSLILVGALLLIAGIMFAPTIAAALGISALFVKIAGFVAGSLFFFAAGAKIWAGTSIEIFDSQIATGHVDRNGALSNVRLVNISTDKTKLQVSQIVLNPNKGSTTK